MEKKTNYNGLDVLKISMALLVAQRHVIQIFFSEDSKWRVVIGAWLSNLAVPVFFTIAGFFLFRKFCRDRSADKILYCYCRRILWLYVVWTAIYLPIDFYNWYHEDGHTLKQGVSTWFHRFLFDSTTPQLWYLPALALACLAVWFSYACGVKIWQLLAVGFVLFAVGTVGNNWYFNQKLPMAVQNMLSVYSQYFLTMRNGIFYGIFFVSLGLMFAKTRWRPPLWISIVGSFVCVLACGWEAYRFYEVNFVFLTAPAAYFLFTAAERIPLPWPESRLYVRLRGMSEWIYFSHFYFFYFLVWTRQWNPVAFSNKSITVMILGATLLFSWVMVRMSETEGGRCLKKLI